MGLSKIIPRYTAFDKAHQESLVRMVIEQSLKLAEHTPSMNSDMVYTIAAFHDLGLINGRENHHKDSRTILEADEFVKSRFSRKQIVTMGRRKNLKRYSTAFSMKKTSRNRPPRRSVFSSDSGYGYTRLNPV